MKLPPLLAVCLGITAAAAGNCQLATPSVGHVRYADGVVRPIYGLPGNYILGDAIPALAEAASFSEAGGLISKGGTLLLTDSNLTPVAAADLHSSAALLRVDRTLDTAIAWIPETRVLVHWNGKSLSPVPVASLGEGDRVTSVRKLDANTASLLVSKPDTTLVRYRISLLEGALQSSNALSAGCNSTWDDGTRILCLSDRKLSILSQAGDVRQTLPLPVDGSLALEQAGTRCLHFSGRTPGENWLLHLDDKDLQFYQIPAPKAGAAPANGANAKSAQ